MPQLKDTLYAIRETTRIQDTSLVFKSFLLLLIVVCAFLVANSAHASVMAQVDRSTISEGDTFTLTLDVSGNNNAQPDLSALHRNFDVIGTGQKNMIQIINGNMKSSLSWTITLSPKHTGKLTIPPITVGNQHSTALTVNVLPAGAASGNDGSQADVFLEVNVKPRQHSYVQQQLIYTVRLYSAVPLRQGTLSKPKLDNAIIQKLGKDSNFQTVRNGRQYQVIERRYAIYPQRSGKLEIPAVVFDGRVDDPSAQTGDAFFDSFNPATRHVRLRSRKLALNIATQPADYQGSNWLPAQNIELSEKWSPANPSFRVGEPVTRDIIIRAKGLSSSQLPDLKQQAPDGLKVYPDQPQTSDKADADTLASRREQKIAMIPTRAGALTLPAIHLTWWDTQSGQTRSAELPAETVHVLPAVTQNAASNPPPAANTGQAKTTSHVSTTNTNKSQPVLGHAEQSQSGGSTRLWMLLSLLLALAWIATVFILWRSTRSKRRAQPEQEDPQLTSLKPAVKLLRLACRQNNPAAVKHSLLSWARVYWRDNPPLSLGALAERVADEALTREIRILDKCIYTDNADDWQAPGLLRSFDAFCKQSAGESPADRDHDLVPLHLKQAAGHR